MQEGKLAIRSVGYLLRQRVIASTAASVFKRFTLWMSTNHPHNRLSMEGKGHMTTKSNKKVVNRFFEEVFNKENLALVDEFVSPNFINHNSSMQVRGTEGVKRGIKAQFEAFPDIQTTIEDIIAEGDKVVVRARDRFTRPSDGKQVELTWIEIIRLEDGKLAEAWVEADMSSIGQLAGEYK
jgi:predicted SnoaL-like aldol condensation-catalyzing enzyme